VCRRNHVCRRRLVQFLFLRVRHLAALAPQQGRPLAASRLPEGEPFYIQHGWINAPVNYPVGLFRFELEVDGQPVQEDFSVRSTDAETALPTLNWTWVFNFPEGMTGDHTFTGHWIAPCQYWVDQGMLSGPCNDPNEMIARSNTAYVSFISE